MKESHKTLEFCGPLLAPFLQGRVLDIGAGDAPITVDAQVFDQDEGNAENILASLDPESFDTVFSSHCLEHMSDPETAIFDWFQLVRPGGTLIVIVPDEDLYEQGHWPSIFNSDHKATFTISKGASWSPVSIDLLDLARKLGGRVVHVAQQEHNYDRSLMTFAKPALPHFPGLWRLASRESRWRIATQILNFWSVDQTRLPRNALAQILLIVEKPPIDSEPVTLESGRE